MLTPTCVSYRADARITHASSHQSLYLSISPRTAFAYSDAITFVMGPGHGIERSSTEFTALTSAAVPHTNISSHTYRSARDRWSTSTSKPWSRAIVITESWVIPGN